jgi:hypothetical protein
MKDSQEALDALADDVGSVSDGFHTFDELYRYRMLYHAWACRAWTEAGYPVVKSHRHSNGELCFGGGWFIVTAQLPTGQVSNHYEDRYWELFTVPSTRLAPGWDGHTPTTAADRIERALIATIAPDEKLVDTAMKRYRKRPVMIEAMHFTGEDVAVVGHEIAKWCGGRFDADAKPSDPTDVRYTILIPTLEGIITANAGDYVIRGVHGEFYPCKPDIFTLTYEAVTESAVTRRSPTTHAKGARS